MPSPIGPGRWRPVRRAVWALGLVACAGDPATPEDTPRVLAPAPRLYGPGDPEWTPQPHRDRPLRVAVTPDGATALVTLQGLEVAEEMRL